MNKNPNELWIKNQMIRQREKKIKKNFDSPRESIFFQNESIRSEPRPVFLIQNLWKESNPKNNFIQCSKM